jgi:uncharacterized membrane protein
MLRAIRTVLAVEGLIMSWRTYNRTRDLEKQADTGDPSVLDAIALTPQSRLFRFPNSVVAMAYFAAMTVLCGTGATSRGPTRRVAVTASWLSVSVSAYLIYQLVFVLRRKCSICMRAHTLNLALTLVVTAQSSVATPGDW